MWCSRCQQDVPAAFAPGAKGRATCARCGRVASSNSTGGDALPSVTTTTAATGSRSPLDFSDWKLEDDLREAQRLVRLIQLQCEGPNPLTDVEALPAEDLAFDRPHRPARAAVREASHGGGSLLAWLVLGCGLSGLVCGCALLIWSHLSGRTELWNIGLPTALVSQAVLMCGIILQFDGSRRAAPAPVEEDAAPRGAATHLHVNTGPAMHAAGLSVHFSTTPQALSQQPAAPTSRQIKQQVEAALRRRAA